MIPKAIDTIAFKDIDNLINQQVTENRSLEFKRDLIGSKDEDKREFLADISAFANTAGGDLIFGVEEDGGRATAIAPINVIDPDAELRRLEDILRSGVDPRIPKYEFRWISNGAQVQVLLIRIHRSWAAPHRVIFKGHDKFYARTSAGKHSLDVRELRAAFNESNHLSESVKAFRRERLNVIESGEAPVPLMQGARLLLHIIPNSAFVDSVSLAPSERESLAPLGASGWNHLHTLEGIATYSGPEDSTDGSRAYTLLFRNGVIEATDTIGHDHDKGPVVFPSSIEGNLIGDLPAYFQMLRKLGVDPPFYVALSLSSVRNCSLATSDSWAYRVRRPLRRDTLIFPEITVEQSEPDVVGTFKPLFDLVWQAFGYPHSFNFDRNGQYVGR